MAYFNPLKPTNTHRACFIHHSIIAQVMRHYYQTRAVHEVLLPNTRSSRGIITKHAQFTRHYYQTRAVHEALLPNTCSSWGIITKHTQFMRHYYQTSAVHETLLPNMLSSWDIITKHAQFMRHYYQTPAARTALLLQHKALNVPTHFVFWRQNVPRLHIHWKHPLGNRRSYFRNKLQHKQHQPLERTLPGSVSHRPASHSAR
jgi:hypothetical protein